MATKKSIPVGPLGHPKGLYLLANLEVWEQFSYYGLLGLLSIYLISPVSNGGFGWTAGSALRLVGLYGGLAYFVAIAGGWLADRHTGSRKAIYYGAVIITLGHLAMLGPFLGPSIVDSLYGISTRDVFARVGMELGQFSLQQTHLLKASQYITQIYPSLSENQLTEYIGALQFSCFIITASFYSALALIIIGTGLLKPNIAVVVGSLYEQSGHMRDSGFTLFYMGISLGGLLSGLVAGTLGEKIGWHWGFMSAGIGMLFGLLVFISKQSDYLDEAGKQAVNIGASDNKGWISILKGLEKSHHRSIYGVITLGIFAAIFWGLFMQVTGLLVVYAYEHVDRVIAGFEIPAPWIVSVNSFFLIIFGPALQFLWKQLGTRGAEPGVVMKFAYGLLSVSIAYLLLGIVEFAKPSASQAVSIFWPVCSVAIMTLGELALWVTGLSLVSRFGSIGLGGLMMGLWYLTFALGGFISGELGALSDRFQPHQLFLTFAFIAAVATGALFILRHRITMLIDGLIRL